MNSYQGPMQPWPALEPHARQVHLPRSDLSLHVYDAGPADAEPLLLVHGLGDEADTWRHLIPPLSARCRVLAPDLPGFGRSDQPDGQYTIDFFQTVLVELLDEVGIAQVTLVGHSLGGAITQSIALASPERVERLILVGGSLVAQSQRLEMATLLFLVPAVGEWHYSRLRRDPDAAYETLRPYYYRLDRLPETERAFLYQRVNERVWSDGQRRAFLSTLRHLARSLPAQQRGLPTRLAQLAVPTVVVWGEHDRVNPIDNGHALVALQPGCRLEVVPGAGHNVHQEDSQAVLAAIGRAIQKPHTRGDDRDAASSRRA